MRELQLDRAVVKVQNLHTRVGAEANIGDTELQLGAAIVVGPQAVPDRDWTIKTRLHPVVVASMGEADLTLQVAKAGGARGRIRLRHGGTGKYGKRDHDVRNTAIRDFE